MAGKEFTHGLRTLVLSEQKHLFFFFSAAATWPAGSLVPRPGIEPVPPAVEAGGRFFFFF